MMERKIETREDYENALKELEDFLFYADMSDDYRVYARAHDVADARRRELEQEARAKGII